MSWKPEVFVEGKWSQNALVFETKEDAEKWAKDLAARWTMVDDSRAVESDKPVTSKYVEGGIAEDIVKLRNG